MSAKRQEFPDSLLNELRKVSTNLQDQGAKSAHILPMIGAMTIITTFLSPYVIRLGWKASDMLNHDREDKSAADTKREEGEEEADRPEK
jgi:hypothetical protein